MTKKLQKIIDRVREKYGHDAVQVHQFEDKNALDEDYSETTISFSAELIDNPFQWDREIQNITGECDSGYGLGWRDLQLCRYFPDLR